MMSIIALAAVPVVLAAADPGTVEWTMPSVSSIPTTITDLEEAGAVLSAALSDYSTYLEALTTQSDYSSVQSAISSAMASSEYHAYTQTTDLNELLYVALETGEPTWWSKLDNSAQRFFTSVAGAEASVLQESLEDDATTRAIPGMAAMAILAAGAAAGAALML